MQVQDIGNAISDTREGPAILLYDQAAAPFNGRMNWSAIVGNVLKTSLSIKGKTGTGAFDYTIPPNSKIDLNIGYP